MDLETSVTAWHEAGHAVAYAEYGRWFRYVTIRPRTPGLTGRVHVGRPRRIGAWDHAVIALAGPAAEAEHLRAAGWDEDAVTGAILFGGGCSGDFENAQAAIKDGVNHAERAADDLVRSCWPAVCAVADRLLSGRGTLTYADVRALIAEPVGGA